MAVAGGGVAVGAVVAPAAAPGKTRSLTLIRNKDEETVDQFFLLLMLSNACMLWIT